MSALLKQPHVFLRARAEQGRSVREIGKHEAGMVLQIVANRQVDMRIRRRTCAFHAHVA